MMGGDVEMKVVCQKSDVDEMIFGDEFHTHSTK